MKQETPGWKQEHKRINEKNQTQETFKKKTSELKKHRKLLKNYERCWKQWPVKHRAKICLQEHGERRNNSNPLAATIFRVQGGRIFPKYPGNQKDEKKPNSSAGLPVLDRRSDSTVPCQNMPRSRPCNKPGQHEPREIARENIRTLNAALRLQLYSDSTWTPKTEKRSSLHYYLHSLFTGLRWVMDLPPLLGRSGFLFTPGWRLLVFLSFYFSYSSSSSTACSSPLPP